MYAQVQDNLLELLSDLLRTTPSLNLMDQTDFEPTMQVYFEPKVTDSVYMHSQTSFRNQIKTTILFYPFCIARLLKVQLENCGMVFHGIFQEIVK